VRSPRELVLDAYTALTLKGNVEQPSRIAPTWVNQSEQRRLAAYKVLAAYREQVAREHMRTTVDAEKRAHREYGEPGLIVDRVVAGILGDDPQIVVEGADDDLPDQPVLPERPAPLEGVEDSIERRSLEAQHRVWTVRAEESITRWEESWAAQPGQRERQDWLREWAAAELFDQQMWLCETDAVSLGDGVYVFGLSHEQQRVKVQVYDPGMYFPVLDDNADRLGYPTKVHIAFEEDLNGDGQPEYVRRITWELAGILPELDVDGMPILDDGGFRLQAGDQRAEDGRIVRRYPWMPTGEFTDVTCYMTDARWKLADVGGRHVDDLAEGKAIYQLGEDGQQLRRRDLRVDFIPIVHNPDTPAGSSHFGRSLLARGVQLFDDLADTDTDLQAAAALAGTPMIGVSGPSVPTALSVRPGAVFGLGEKGTMMVPDLSGSVTALRELVDDLLDRLSVNLQVPAPILGRLEPAESDRSGVARAHRFGPYISLINLFRLVRESKYPLVFKFVQRLAQAGGYLPEGPTMPARLAFGSFLPADRAAAVEELVKLLEAKSISRRTGLRLLVEVGFDIDDVVEELARIEREDIEAARELFEATGDQDAVNARLGLDVGAGRTNEPPVPVLPPAPAT
jgi:hypothetical protein